MARLKVEGFLQEDSDGIMMRRILYQAKWRMYHPTAFACFGEISANEKLSVDELMMQQEVARQKLVRSAMTTSVFYRKNYGSVGFEFGDIGKDGWFETLPIVTKQHIREHFEEIIDPANKQFLRISTTGGSTGMPTKTGYDRRIPEEVYSWRLQSLFGVHPWDDHAYIWRDRRASNLAKFKNSLLWWPLRSIFGACCRMGGGTWTVRYI